MFFVVLWAWYEVALVLSNVPTFALSTQFSIPVLLLFAKHKVVSLVKPQPLFASLTSITMIILLPFPNQSVPLNDPALSVKLLRPSVAFKKLIVGGLESTPIVRFSVELSISTVLLNALISIAVTISSQNEEFTVTEAPNSKKELLANVLLAFASSRILSLNIADGKGFTPSPAPIVSFVCGVTSVVQLRYLVSNVSVIFVKAASALLNIKKLRLYACVKLP